VNKEMFMDRLPSSPWGFS